MPAPLDPTKRFSDRVAYYHRHRPSFPRELLALLKSEAGLRAHHTVADLGSGTGLLSELFVGNGNRVLGIEPNLPMAAAARGLLGDRPRFHGLLARAEGTALRYGVIDFVVAGQAFHWFDPRLTAAELRRILRPGGVACMVWNQRRRDTPFLADYECFLEQWGADYRRVASRYEDPAALERLFGPAGYDLRQLDNAQTFDLEGLRGRLLSSSYIPLARADLLTALEELFDRHQESGAVHFEYDTRVYFGALS